MPELLERGLRHPLIALAFWFTAGSIANADLIGVASVIDGDTIEIHGQRIRLYGIDAPESRQTCLDAGGRAWRCGQRAALALQDFIGRRTVRCDERDVDRYGRGRRPLRRRRYRYQPTARVPGLCAGRSVLFDGLCRRRGGD